MSSTIQLVRASRLIDMVWPYRVLVDGEPTGSVRNGETVSIPIAAGTHTVQLRSLHIVNRHLGLASTALPLDVRDGQTLELVCGSPSPMNALPLWLRCLFGGRTRWIELEAVSGRAITADDQRTEANVAVPTA
jgi:hypothetical protein